MGLQDSVHELVKSWCQDMTDIFFNDYENYTSANCVITSYKWWALQSNWLLQLTISPNDWNHENITISDDFVYNIYVLQIHLSISVRISEGNYLIYLLNFNINSLQLNWYVILKNDGKDITDLDVFFIAYIWLQRQSSGSMHRHKPNRLLINTALAFCHAHYAAADGKWTWYHKKQC